MTATGLAGFLSNQEETVGGFSKSTCLNDGGIAREPSKRTSALPTCPIFPKTRMGPPKEDGKPTPHALDALLKVSTVTAFGINFREALEPLCIDETLRVRNFFAWIGKSIRLIVCAGSPDSQQSTVFLTPRNPGADSSR